MRSLKYALCLVAALPVVAAAAETGSSGPAIGPVPIEFLLFGAVLLGVALSHGHTLRIALTGAIVIALYKSVLSPFDTGSGVLGFVRHLGHEWVILVNLLLLLVGFALLAKHFEDSEVPAVLPRFLPNDWTGSLVLLILVFVLSGFLDNIAAAMIGGAIAHTVYRGKVHIGFLAALVAAANAGGAGSVVGDTTTTMMWIAGVPPVEVVHAYLGAAVALAVFGIPASVLQQRYSPIQKDESPNAHIDWVRVGVVGTILVAAVAVNITINTRFTDISDRFPFLGAAVWVALLGTAPVRRPDWRLAPEAVKGSIFLLSLVLCASMMPVEKLPLASWQSAFGLGFTSAVFDNIPLTALALNQGGYDWGFLAYAVGFGGSMVWFGSSAGVALSNMFPEAKDAGRWLRHGWFVLVAYAVGFVAMLLLLGFHPGTAPRTVKNHAPPAAVSDH